MSIHIYLYLFLSPQKSFQLCAPLTSDLDIANFISDLMGNWMGTVQYNDEGGNPITINYVSLSIHSSIHLSIYPSTLRIDGWNNNINLTLFLIYIQLCNIMDSASDPLTAYVQINQLFLNSSGVSTYSLHPDDSTSYHSITTNNYVSYSLPYSFACFLPFRFCYLFTQSTCLDVSYNDFLNQLKATKIDLNASVGFRQWTYQTCMNSGR